MSGPLHPGGPEVFPTSPLPCPLSPGPARVQAQVRVGLAFATPDMAFLSSFFLGLTPLLCPLAPRKGSWLADKVKRLMRPRREGGPHGGPRLGADGAGSTESLGGPPETELPEGREADGTGGSGGPSAPRDLLVPLVFLCDLCMCPPLAFPAAASPPPPSPIRWSQ